MIPTRLDAIAAAIGAPAPAGKARVAQVCVDSRRVGPDALFVALPGRHTDGHRFLGEAFRNGAAAAIVAAAAAIEAEPGWRLLKVAEPLAALQRLARWYRRTALGQVVAITGSNGKTVVKDALATLFAGRNALASPGSFNSQVGLPLAVLSGSRTAELAFLEAGISEPGEMALLADIAAPDFGILTNIGMAHLAAFGSREAIAAEKLRLFADIPPTGWLLAPDDPILDPLLGRLECRVQRPAEILNFTPGEAVEDGQSVDISNGSGKTFTFRVNTRSPHLLADLHIAAAAAHRLGLGLGDIAAALDGYAPRPTRMEFRSSPERVRIVNDASSADPVSVHAALRAAALGAAESGRKIFVFAGMRELGAEARRAHAQVGTDAAQYGFSHLLLLGGEALDATAAAFRAARPDGEAVTVGGVPAIKDHLLPLLRPGDTVLFKGPRDSGLARAARELSGSIAQRCLWLELSAIAGNIARFQRHCGGRVKIMAMLKALAYGTDLVQLAAWMAELGIHHIGVSSTGEGMAVRKVGVTQDIYVVLPDRDDADNLARHRLTPILYSAELVAPFAATLAGSGRVLDVHLMVNTGMNHLGVEPEEAVGVARAIAATGTLRLTGLATHFAAADDPAADGFTRGKQIATFDRVIAELRAAGFAELTVHAANTAAAVRFPEAHYDMVRIGIGLYGVYGSAAVREAMALELAVGVTSRIASIRTLRAGEAVGYNLTFRAPRPMRIGIVPFGYDDGLPWGLAGSGYHALVDGRPAPIVGRICMDQLQLDLSALPEVESGAEVLLYGAHGGYQLRPEEVAAKAGSIPHELLVRLGKRVERIYIEP